MGRDSDDRRGDAPADDSSQDSGAPAEPAPRPKREVGRDRWPWDQVGNSGP